jgi:hypothetical protein
MIMFKGRKFNYRWAEKDDRDFPFKHIMRLSHLPKLPEEVDLTKESFYPPVWDQGEQGSCTAQAACAVKTFITRRYVPHQDDLSIDGFYWCERFVDGNTLLDSGSDGRTSGKVMLETGVGSAKIWGYDDSHFLKEPPKEYFEDANKNKIGAFYFLHGRIQMQRCLAAGFPFVFGTYIPCQMMADDFNGILDNCSTNDMLVEDGGLAGHQMSCFGYKKINGKLFFKVRNSWGTDWCDGGHFWYSADMMTNPDWCDDAITYRLAREPGI